MISKLTSEQVSEAFKEKQTLLSEKEADVLTHFYGLGLQTRHSLQEIGDRYHVTRERIRQLKERALKKLNIK